MACSPVPKVGGAAAPSAPPVPTPMCRKAPNFRLSYPALTEIRMLYRCKNSLFYLYELQPSYNGSTHIT